MPLLIDAQAIRMFRTVVSEARGLIRQRNEIERLDDIRPLVGWSYRSDNKIILDPNMKFKA
jgi:hypothetical protein